MKDDIITIRVSREVKDLIVQAAKIIGADYKQFVSGTLKHVSLQVINAKAKQDEEHEQTK